MDDKKSYADEIFEWRKARYQKSKRTKLPSQEALETCLRINRDALNRSAPIHFENDLLQDPQKAPAGEALPADLFDSDFDFNPITGQTTLSGSGGSMTLDQNTCMVDIAAYFVDAALSDSCGECTFCRVGSTRMLETLKRICSGKGVFADLEVLEDLARKISETSLCQVGKKAANPVLATLHHHKNQYLEHIENHICSSQKCSFSSQSDS